MDKAVVRSRQVILPTQNEIHRFLTELAQHVSQVEYYAERLNAGTYDTERPHDLVGPGNKLTPEVAMGLSLQYRKVTGLLPLIKTSVRIHNTQQRHHIIWRDLSSDTPDSDALLSAIDSVSSFRENREYQGGFHTYDHIREKLTKQQAGLRTEWMHKAITLMEALDTPLIGRITSPTNVPNIGIDASKHAQVQELIAEAHKKSLMYQSAESYFSLLQSLP